MSLLEVGARDIKYAYSWGEINRCLGLTVERLQEICMSCCAIPCPHPASHAAPLFPHAGLLSGAGCHAKDVTVTLPPHTCPCCVLSNTACSILVLYDTIWSISFGVSVSPDKD